MTASQGLCSSELLMMMMMTTTIMITIITSLFMIHVVKFAIFTYAYSEFGTPMTSISLPFMCSLHMLL
jgi:hypothetical protein